MGGNDTLDGGAGNDSLYGGTGNNSLSGGTGNDSVMADSGNNFLSGDSGDETVAGGTGNDVLFGGDGSDTLIGGGGNDLLDGSDGNDNVGNVTLTTYSATLDGGTGVDVLELRAAGSAHIDSGKISTVQSLHTGQPLPASSFQNFKIFRLTLSVASDWVKPGAGNDYVGDQGGGGHIRTGPGDDGVNVTIDQAIYVDGGSGNDGLGIVVHSAKMS